MRYFDSLDSAPSVIVVFKIESVGPCVSFTSYDERPEHIRVALHPLIGVISGYYVPLSIFCHSTASIVTFSLPLRPSCVYAALLM